MKPTLLLPPLLLALLGLGGCTDDTAPGQEPEARVVVRSDPASTSDCEHGGTVVSSGLDHNGNGLLDDAEVAERSVLCQDAPEPAAAVLTRVEKEPAGPHCAGGGSAVLSGPDSDHDGVLENTEVVSTTYICEDVLLTRMAAEPPGANCGGGGIVFSIGRDRDGDGELGADEVEWTEYECSQVISHDVTVTSDADAALLANILSIQGSLLIDGATVHALNLPELQHVGGRVLVRSNPWLDHLSLPGLQDVSGYLEISDNASLTAVDLGSLKTITGDVYVGSNAKLQTLAWSHIVSVGFDFSVDDNAALTDVDMPYIVHGDVTVSRNPLLTQLNFSSGASVKSLTVHDNGIERLDVFVSKYLDFYARLGPVFVYQNPSLTEVHLSAQATGTINLRDNDKLASVSVSTDTVDGNLRVEGASLKQIFASPSSSASTWLTIVGQLSIDGPVESLLLQLDGRNKFGSVDIRNTRLTTMDYLFNTVEGTLHLEHNPLMTYFRAVRVGGDLVVADNDELIGFYIIKQDELGGDVRFIGNEKLTTLNGLQWPSSLPGSLVITDNPSLVRPAIYGPTSIKGDLVIQNNPNLTAVDLNAVTQIGGLVSIRHNGITTWSGLDELSRVERGLSIEQNPQLADIVLSKLERVFRWLHIDANAELRTFDFPALVAIESPAITDNPHLPACAVDQFFARFPGAHGSQQGNDTTATCP